ncbi:MAG: hypothetical protein EAZ55_12995 [Cytophagales bacterium]|nr:MAG: hypothetical protein EAZ55_12995 [Cytophagales bacterium]
MSPNKPLFLPFILLFLVLEGFLLGSCANRIPPTGGAKDTLAPQVKALVPVHKSLQYKGDRLEIVFDEFIKEENLQKQLIITPQIKDFRYRLLGKKIQIRWAEPLSENTTYSFNFRNAIKDITEGNPAPNLQIAFSTGDQLDTMFVTGQAKNLLYNTTPKELIVALYNPNDTLRIDKHPPYYYTISEDGFFYLPYVKKANYEIYAFEDKNNNKIYEEGENIAFLPNNITLTDSSQNDLMLLLCKEDHKKPKLIAQQPNYQYLTLKFNESLQSFRFTEPNSAIAYQQSNTNPSEVTLYNLNNQYDSLALQFTAQDSTGNTLDTTCWVAFKKIEKNKYTPFNAEITLASGAGIERDWQLRIEFTKPVATWNAQKIYFVKDLPQKITQYNWINRAKAQLINTPDKPQSLILNEKQLRWNENKTLLSIDTNIAFKENIQIFIAQEAFLSIENDTLRLVNELFQKKDTRKLGTISGTINTEEPYYLLQLISEGKIIEQISPTKSFEFDFLSPGTYQIRIIIDKNNNGRWDASDFRNKKTAEPVWYYPKNLALRENWDIQGEVIEF